MPGAVEFLFLISLFIIIYTYAGYPVIVFLLTRIKKIFVRSARVPAADLPPVSLIVTAYNEEKIIREKIGNCLSLNYPQHLLTILFVTDGSDDDSINIIREYPNIILLHEPARRGKLSAMNRAVSRVDSPVIIFSDANALLNKDCITNIVRHYADPKVGAVAGEKRILQKEDSLAKGEGLYWKYESLLKKLDSDLKTTVGAAGELFSIRTSLYGILPGNTILEDFVQSLSICLKGYVVKYEPLAFAEEPASLSIRDEMERKIRISAGGFQAISMLKQLFNFFRYPVISFQFISHRVLRWTLCPLAIITCFITSIWLYSRMWSVFYEAIVILQICFYILAAIGWWLALKDRQIKLFFIPFYFLFMNFCVFAGFWRYINKKQSVVWDKAER